MINDFLCERTGCKIYSCEVKKINATTGTEIQVEIFNDLFVLYPISINEQSNDIKFNGRSANIKYKMLISQAQRKKIKVGMKVACNSTLFFTQTLFNPNLKPFDYDILQKDILEFVIHQIDPIYDGCNYEFVCSLISYN
jgi:hypothetical protein